MPKGLLNPKNAVESSGGGFQEGYVMVAASSFVVHQSMPRKDGSQAAPVTALLWLVGRLDDDQEPIVNEEGDPLTEKLTFSFGGKSVGQIHPANASGPDEEETEDLGEEVGVEGATIHLVNKDFKLNKKSSLMILMESLKNSGFKEEYLDRVWAPDFVGMVAHMKSQTSEEKINGQAITYKIVDKIVRAPYEGKGKGATGKTGGAAKAGAAGGDAGKGPSKNAEAEAALKPILEKMSETLDGQNVTRKALTTRISTALQQGKVAPGLHIPVMSLVKDDSWLKKNAAKYDMTVDFEEGMVQFGTPAAEEE